MPSALKEAPPRGGRLPKVHIEPSARMVCRPDEREGHRNPEATIPDRRPVRPVCSSDTPGAAGSTADRATTTGRTSPASGPVVAQSQGAFLAALRSDTEVAALRSDAQANLLSVAWCYTRHANWETLDTFWSRQAVADACGLSPETVKKWVRWLRAHGWLELRYPGSTPLLRAELLGQSRRGNLAAVYRLTVPRRHTRYGRPQVQRSPTSHRESSDADTSPAPPGSEHADCASTLGTRLPSGKYPPTWVPEGKTGRGVPPRAREKHTPHLWPLHQSPTHRRDRLAAAARLRAESPTLARLSARGLRHRCKTFFQAGWTPADVLHALDHHPDGSPRPAYTQRVRHVASWLTHRLASWTSSEDTPLPPHSQRLAQAHAATHAAQTQRHRDHAAARAAATIPTTAYHAAADAIRARSATARLTDAHTHHQRSTSPQTQTAADFEARRQAHLTALATWINTDPAANS